MSLCVFVHAYMCVCACMHVFILLYGVYIIPVAQPQVCELIVSCWVNF